MKIAIVGSGIAGNVAAYHLCKEHDITVFEAGDHIGGHTHTHDIHWDGTRYAVDTGFIVFNYATYPHFTQLLHELDVPVQASDMSFSVKSENGGLEYNGSSLNTLFAQRSNLFSPSFLRMLRDVMRFNREAAGLVGRGGLETTLGEFLQAGRFSREFIEHYLIPMASAIWSADPARMRQFPVGFLIRFFHNHGLLSISQRPQWYVIQGGSREYVRKLTAPFAGRVRVACPVERITRHATHVTVKPAGQEPERFDQVFIAAHSDQALRMLADPSPAEREVLGAIPYQVNEAVLHTDCDILPRRRRAWAAWNYHLLPAEHGRVPVTYNMNILQGLSAPVQFCVTLNNSKRIDPARVLKRITYHHPVFTPEGIAAQQRHRELNGANRTYYCGAYWRHGFHEDGVVSALDALSHFREQTHEQLPLRRAS
ncbi:MAG: FAD-dependent oxidoreductase [Gammaproteobacteria bacterium]